MRDRDESAQAGGPLWAIEMKARRLEGSVVRDKDESAQAVRIEGVEI